MQLQEIRSAARDLGLRPGRYRKPKLIKMIQLQEGNFDCYGSAVEDYCDQNQCSWREDCFTEKP